MTIALSLLSYPIKFLLLTKYLFTRMLGILIALGVLGFLFYSILVTSATIGQDISDYWYLLLKNK